MLALICRSYGASRNLGIDNYKDCAPTEHGFAHRKYPTRETNMLVLVAPQLNKGCSGLSNLTSGQKNYSVGTGREPGSRLMRLLIPSLMMVALLIETATA